MAKEDLLYKRNASLTVISEGDSGSDNEKLPICFEVTR